MEFKVGNWYRLKPEYKNKMEGLLKRTGNNVWKYWLDKQIRYCYCSDTRKSKGQDILFSDGYHSWIDKYKNKRFEETGNRGWQIYGGTAEWFEEVAIQEKQFLLFEA